MACFFRKSRNMITVSVLIAMFGRVVPPERVEDRLMSELYSVFDQEENQTLMAAEVNCYWGANEMDFKHDQVRKWFGREDMDKDSYGQDEFEDVFTLISASPALSPRRRIAADGSWLSADFSFGLLCGVGLALLVSGAITLRTFQRAESEVSKLEAEMKKLAVERSLLEKQQAVMLDVQQKQEAAQKQLEEEVVSWQREALLAKSKLEKVMLCIEGMDAFVGSGKAKFESEGAQQGFAKTHSTGLAAGSITFGTVDNGQLLVYETSESRILGCGRDGAYRCTDLSTGTEKALKMYEVSGAAQRNAILNDLWTLRSKVSAHPKVVNYERVIESESRIFVVMELLPGKDLLDVIIERGLMEAEAQPLFADLVEAVQQLHDNQVIHCDIKPDNVVVVGNISSDDAQAKLIDFGASCFLRYKDDPAKGSIVADGLMPPEHAANFSLSPSIATDMWRLGCTLYTMLLRTPPFLDDVRTPQGRQQRELSNFSRTVWFETLSADAKDLISSLLVGDPNKRPTTAEVLEHPWVRGARPRLRPAEGTAQCL